MTDEEDNNLADVTKFCDDQSVAVVMRGTVRISSSKVTIEGGERAMAKKLTARQLRWAEEYPVDLNATQAALRAGYSKKSARQSGHQNITNYNLMELARVKMREASERTGIDADYVLTRVRDTIERCAQAVPVLGPFGSPPRRVRQRIGQTVGSYLYDK